MSVRDTGGREPRRMRARRASASPRLRFAPLTTVVAALAIAIAATTSLGLGHREPSASARPSATVAGLAPLPRTGGGGQVHVESPPPVDAPRRTAPAQAATAPSDAQFLELPPCAYDDLPATDADLDDWARTLVDTAFALPDGYRPTDLVPVDQAGIGGAGSVRALVIDDLRALATAAADAANPLAVQSAYRSRSRQATVFAEWVASSGEAEARRFSARPGHSEHQLGTAVDFRAMSGGAPWTGSFGASKAGRWLAAHATAFGFVMSYPPGAEATSCYGAEAWHFRYVGREMAAEVEGSGLPLRAWLWREAHGG